MRRWPSPWQASQRPPFTLKLKRPGTIAAFARFGKHGVELADRSEDAGVSGGIRARSAADGRLVDLNDFVDVLDAGDGAMCAGLFHGTVKLRCEGAIENVVHERGFAGTGDAGDDGEQAERKSDVDIFQIIAVRAEDGERFSIGRGADAGTGIFTRPERYCPVSDAEFAAISSGGPQATRWPPALPAPGPRSTT